MNTDIDAAPDMAPGLAPLGPLAGLKVLELGQLIAGPFAAKTLADFGADVVKVEPPDGGDPLRRWRLLRDGTSVWWQVQSRNKRSLALDLKDAAAQDIVRRLALEADVLIENFRPGALEGFKLAPDDLVAANPRLIVLRISGYGQTGPYRDKPGFGVVAEAMGGLRHLSGEPGRTPVRVGVSIGDTLAALHGVIGVLMALHERHKSGRGQVVDVALYEAVFNCMESLLPEYSAFGAVRGPAGSALPGIAPSNAYACRDGYALVAGNGDSIFRRLMHAIGRDDLGRDPALADNTGRVARVDEIDAAIGAWTATRSVDEVLAMLDAAAVPAGRIYTVADIARDPHYRARGMLMPVTLADGSTLLTPGIVPKLSRTPGALRRNAPTLAQDNDEVLGGLPPRPPEPALVDHLDHLVLTTADEAACIDFYTRVLGLGLETFVGGTPPVERRALRFGAQKINLHVSGREFEPKAARPTPGALDLCFISALPITRVIERLEAANWPIVEGPVRRTGAAGPIVSVYVRDPDGNLVEIAEPA